MVIAGFHSARAMFALPPAYAAQTPMSGLGQKRTLCEGGARSVMCFNLLEAAALWNFPGFTG